MPSNFYQHMPTNLVDLDMLFKKKWMIQAFTTCYKHGFLFKEEMTCHTMVYTKNNVLKGVFRFVKGFLQWNKVALNSFSNLLLTQVPF